MDQRYSFLFFFLMLGVLLLIYGSGLRPFNLAEFTGFFIILSSVTIILLGTATKDILYYMIWGITLFFVGFYILTFVFVNILLLIGIYFIIISILVFFMLRKK
ncbi:MAG TPA: hypothetical protein VKU94_03090 [Geobacterales bacterium]|nr:hypothetical protein [Geobacterales bacterium]